MSDSLPPEGVSIQEPHPFDDPRIKAVVAKYAPEYSDSLAKAVRPGFSSAPSELERWEGRKILDRKKRRVSGKGVELESDFAWLQRVLYEETFSMDQNPGVASAEFQESGGMTLGGLLSHCFFPGRINNVRLADVIGYDLKGDNLREMIRLEPDMAKRLLIATFAIKAYNPDSRPDEYQRVARYPDTIPIRQGLDSYGYRLLKVFKDVPELTKPVMDPKLKSLYIKDHDKEVNLAEFVQGLWAYKLGRLNDEIFDIGGMWRQVGGDEEATAVRGLNTLLFVRTHPEMQVLYRFLSPSGYLVKG